MGLVLILPLRLLRKLKVEEIMGAMINNCEIEIDRLSSTFFAIRAHNIP